MMSPARSAAAKRYVASSPYSSRSAAQARIARTTTLRHAWAAARAAAAVVAATKHSGQVFIVCSIKLATGAA